MWQISNNTGYACAGTFLRDADGREHWCVAIRATFERQSDGRIQPAAEQIAVNLAPRFAGEDDQILLADDDFIPFAPVTDILIRGLALPAADAPRPAPLSVEIGALRKLALLYPPRQARLSRGAWRLADIAPQQPAALGWEASFGGTLPGTPDDQPPENPLGTGLALRAPRLFEDGTRIDLPRIEGMGMDCQRDPHGARSIGFGPVPRWWRDRVALAGRFDDVWRRDRAPAMPADYDPRFLCSAPRDQLPAAHLRGGEPVNLRGFTGTREWQFRLPQALFRIETRLGGQLVPLSARIARIDLWPSDDLISMLWLGTLACNGRDHLVETTRISLRQLSGVAT
jgi:hypothetical protein